VRGIGDRKKSFTEDEQKERSRLVSELESLSARLGAAEPGSAQERELRRSIADAHRALAKLLYPDWNGEMQ